MSRATGAITIERNGIDVVAKNEHTVVDTESPWGDEKHKTSVATVPAIISRPRVADVRRSEAQNERPVGLILHVPSGEFAPFHGGYGGPYGLSYKGSDDPDALAIHDGTDEYEPTQWQLHGVWYNTVKAIPQGDGTTRVEVTRR